MVVEQSPEFKQTDLELDSDVGMLLLHCPANIVTVPPQQYTRVVQNARRNATIASQS